MYRPLALCLTVILAGSTLPAHADGAFLSRLSANSGAMKVDRPRGENAVVGVRLEGLRGQEGRVTGFGQVFRKGDWPKGRALVAEAGGKRIPLQTDIKARHADGSVRHAILSLRNPPALTAQLALRVADPVPSAKPVDIASVLERGYDLAVVFDFKGRKVTLDVATLLEQAVRGGPDARPDLWLNGPFASEIRIVRRLTQQLTAIFDIRVLADGAVRTSVSMHNDSMIETNNLDITYGYTIRMSGKAMVERTVTHHRYANWREVVWAGAQPSSAHVAYDYPYMIATGAVPAYDPELRIDRRYLEGWPEKLASADTGPMGNALIGKAMRKAGERGDIGIVPEWTLAWLRTQSPQHYRAMMQTAEAAGSVPWHLRDPGTRRAPAFRDHPKYWMDARATRAANGHGPIKTDVDGWQIGAAHQPGLTYIPYLVSGDRYLLDELHAQVAAGYFAHPPARRDGETGMLEGMEVQAQAWINRTHGHAAWITPDDHPAKRALTADLRARMAGYARAYRRSDRLGGPASAETAGWIEGSGGSLRNGQQDIFVATLAGNARMGVVEAGAVFGMMRPWLLNRFLRGDFDPRWATAAETMHRDPATGAPYATWAQIARANIAARRFDPRPVAQAGQPERATGNAAQARAGYAAMLGAFADPLLAEAYAMLVRNTPAMQGGGHGFGQHPGWAIVPVFPDGTTLPLARHSAVEGRARGSRYNDLLAGGPQADMILGEDGNDIVAGLDGNDTIAGGLGFNLLAGGRGDDRIVAEGGITIAAGGPGADTFYVGRKAEGGPAPLGRLEIVDFRPGTDRIALPPSLRDHAAVLRRARAVGAGTLIPLGKGASILLRGVKPGALRADSLAMR